MNERNWLIVTGTGKKKILILNRMDYKSLDHKEWNTILKKYLNLYQFYILDIPEKLAQENYNFNNSNISYFAEEVVCFIKKKNLKFNAILGISLGGMICQQLLEYNEFKKTPKILVSTNVYASIKLKAIFSSLYKNLEFFGVNGFRIALESWVTKISDLPTFQCKEYNHIDNSIEKNKLRISLIAVANHDCRKLVSDNNDTLYVFFGTESVLLNTDEAEEFAKYIPSDRILFLDNVSTRIIEEKPNLILDKLINICNGDIYEEI